MQQERKGRSKEEASQAVPSFGRLGGEGKWPVGNERNSTLHSLRTQEAGKKTS